jgi:hypothetical protein
MDEGACYINLFDVGKCGQCGLGILHTVSNTFKSSNVAHPLKTVINE